MQGLRLANPTIGETMVVYGLGLVGLILVQLLKAQGCEVIGIDFDENKLKLAKKFGAQTLNLNSKVEPSKFVKDLTTGIGCDAVFIATATDSNSPIEEAASMCRAKGRIVLIGIAGLNLRRDYFYDKELSFQVSCSYGPGRYDKNYEEKNLDYPIGQVRWTAKRNFETILSLIKSGSLDFKSLISNIYKFQDALEAYEALETDKKNLGLVLDFEGIKAKEKAGYINIASNFSKI